MNATAASSAELQLAAGGSSDLDSVIEIMNAAFDDRFGEAWTRSQCAGILPMPGVSLMIARFGDGRVAGFSLQRGISDEAELLLLAVSPEFRRRASGRCFSTSSSTRRAITARAEFIWKFAKEIRQLSCIGQPVLPWLGVAANITGDDLAANSTR